MGTDTCRSATYNLWLTFHSNHGLISYRFLGKRRFQSNIANSPCTLRPRKTEFPLELGTGAWSQKTKVMGLPGRESYLAISGYNTPTWRTHGRTDRRTDTGWQQRPRLRIASGVNDFNAVQYVGRRVQNKGQSCPRYSGVFDRTISSRLCPEYTDCKPAFHLVPGPSSRSTRAYGHSKYQSSNRFGVEDLAHTILSVLSAMSRHGIMSGNVLAGIANGDMLSLPRQVVPVGHLVVSVASVFLHCALAYCNRSCL